jgi:hypothetical protein
MRQYSLSSAARERIDARFGFSAAKNEPSGIGGRLFPLIPVLPELSTEVTVQRNPIDRDELKRLGDLAVDRVKRVAKALLAGSGAGTLSDVVLDSAWLFIRRKLRNRLLSYAGFELARQGFVK